MHLPIDEIEVGERRREDVGDIDGLAASMQKYGLLHPVVIDDEKRLVAGGRRLLAARRLGWATVEVSPIGLLTDAARREIELEENLRRKDLTSYEQSKTLTDLVKTATQVARETRSESDRVSGARGPSRDPGSLRDVSQRIGIPKTDIIEARHHVETADAFPVLQSPAWKQYHVLQAKEQIERLPASERSQAVAIIEQSQVPPQAAIPILTNLASMPSEKRREVFALNESDDPRDKSLALTTAADRPPMPDPRLTRVDRAVAELREAVKPFPSDPLTPRVEAVIAELRAIARAIKHGGQADAEHEAVA